MNELNMMLEEIRTGIWNAAEVNARHPAFPQALDAGVAAVEYVVHVRAMQRYGGHRERVEKGILQCRSALRVILPLARESRNS